MIARNHLILAIQEGDRPTVSFSDDAARAPVTIGEGATLDQETTIYGDGAPQDDSSGGSNSFWIMLVLLFGFMWFFVIRPENKRQKKRREFQTSLKKGDDVVTAGGLHGSIAAIDDLTITLKVADNVRMKFDRVAIGRNASSAAEAGAMAKK